MNERLETIREQIANIAIAVAAKTAEKEAVYNFSDVRDVPDDVLCVKFWNDGDVTMSITEELLPGESYIDVRHFVEIAVPELVSNRQLSEYLAGAGGAYLAEQLGAYAADLSLDFDDRDPNAGFDLALTLSDAADGRGFGPKLDSYDGEVTASGVADLLSDEDDGRTMLEVAREIVDMSADAGRWVEGNPDDLAAEAIAIFRERAIEAEAA